MALPGIHTVGERLAAALAAPGTLLLVLAFFMPWYSITCGDLTLATATGYDLATSGFHSPLASDSTPGAGGSVNIPPPPGSATTATANPPSRDAWLVLLPLCALVALGGIAVAWLARRPRMSLLVAGSAAFVALVIPFAHALVLRGRLHEAIATRVGADPVQRNVAVALEQSVVSHLERGWYLAVLSALLATIAVGAWWRASAERRAVTAK